ncbi:MAG TPA: MBL fold metallo-hydrolase, partial [Dermatophilaceae bacterium]|nr:MBL fold metallo-hydrolase [Dermatophilaceae bacterium]
YSVGRGFRRLYADHLDQGRFPALVRANPDAVLHADPQSAALLGEQDLTVAALVAGMEVTIGEVTLSPRGAQHAFNHAGVPTVANVGVRIEAPGEPSLFHPGDAYDAEPGQVDVLAVPINAPWCAVRDTIDFVRRLGPGSILPIHDALLAPPGRGLYLTHVQTHGGTDLTVHDLGRGESATIA